MDKVIKNYKEPEMKPMSNKRFIVHIYKTVKNKIKRKNKVVIQNADTTNVIPENINVVSLAIIVDNVVVDVMNVQDSFSEILLKGPSFVLLSKNEKRPLPGWEYVEGKFIPFEEYAHSFPITLRG